MATGIPLILGRAPEPLSVLLTRGGSFTARLQCKNDAGEVVNWPASSTLRLRLSHSGQEWSWPWSISGPTATLSVPATTIAELPNRELRAQLWLNYGDGEFLWCSGTATFHD